MWSVGCRECLQHFCRASCSYWKNSPWTGIRALQFIQASVKAVIRLRRATATFKGGSELFLPEYTSLEASIEKEKPMQIQFSGYYS